MQRAYTLGDFFAVWGQPLGPDQVGPVTGNVTAFYDGKVYATQSTTRWETTSKSSSTAGDHWLLPSTSSSRSATCAHPSRGG